ncbi:MAG: glycosyltransferase family 4 protein [Bacteroidota bacterium]|nr:glycosyltransferase family 4 protein [Bacteroidota bacterium]
MLPPLSPSTTRLSGPVTPNPDRPRILVVVNVYRPDLGGGVLFTDLCEGLAERGLDVTVRCAVPYYPEWTDKEDKNGLRIHEWTEGGVRIQRFGLYIPSNPNSLIQRLIYEASFFLSLMRRPIKKGEFDAIMVFCPLVGAVGYAGLNARSRKIPLWLNVQDLSAQAAAAGGIGGPTSILEKVQNALFRKAEFWSSISPPMIQALERVPGAPETVALIPNWMHRSLARHLSGASAKPAPPPDRPIHLLYSGNIGGKQHLLPFCKRLAEVDASFQLRIHGAGSRANEIADWITVTGDARFEMAPLTDEAGLARALAWADAYVITEKPGAGSSFIPSKLIPGMTSATPILAVCDPDGPLGQEVAQNGIGFMAGWDDPDALKRFFDLLASSPEEHASWSRNALQRSTFYDRDRAIDRCVTAFENLMRSHD